MAKIKGKKGIFKLVHLEAVAVLAAYFLISNYVFAISVAHHNIYFSFIVPLVFGVLSTFIFLYLFSHRDFFPFINSLERAQKKNEKKYLSKFKHYGKLITCILVSGIGGAIFLALTVRFLFSEPENRYQIAAISTIISTVFFVTMAKGFLGMIF